MAKFKYKNILVTGGAGFIGSHLTRKLLDLGYKVTVIDDLTEGKWENLPNHPNLKKVEGTILSNMNPLARGKDVIFHLAALPRVQRSIKYPLDTHKVNVDGTLNLLLAARDKGIKRFIFSSSSSVYGNQDKLPFVETMKPNPLSPYGLHKLIGEEYCELFSSLWRLGTISLRYFNVYGPGMNPDGAYANLIPKFIKLIKNNKTPVINGKGKQTRDFTFIDDVVEANILAARSDLSGEIINIGSGKSISVNEVAKSLNKLLGKDIKPEHGPAVIEPRFTLASNQKARKLLGWKPKVSFNEGIQRML